MTEADRYDALLTQVMASLSWLSKEPAELRRCRYLLEKGAFERLREEGLSAWMQSVVARRSLPGLVPVSSRPGSSR